MSVELEINGGEEEEYILRVLMPKQEVFTIETIIAPFIDTGIITSVVVFKETVRYIQ
jgi:hypothetical protein